MTAIEFTGERFIPGEGGAQIAYEHLHRYLFALRFAEGRAVLDAAAGAGYGTALLAGRASRACGIEIDPAAVASAKRMYRAPNLAFVQGDATRLPAATGSFDLVTAFEVLEHVEDPEGLIRETARVCRGDGIVLVSTPNKSVYSDARGYRNPFHVREFYREEFRSLLCASFRNVLFFTQQVRAGSLIAPEQGAEGWEVVTGPPPDEARAPVEPMYFIALCGNAPLEGLLACGSAYLDPTDALLAEWGAEAERLNRVIDELGGWGKALESDLARRDQTLRRTLDEVGERDRTIEGLQQEIAREIASRDRSIEGLQRDFGDRTRWAESLRKDVADRDALLRQTTDALERTDRELRAAERILAEIRRTLVYRVLSRLHVLPR